MCLALLPDHNRNTTFYEPKQCSFRRPHGFPGTLREAAGWQNVWIVVSLANFLYLLPSSPLQDLLVCLLVMLAIEKSFLYPLPPVHPSGPAGTSHTASTDHNARHRPGTIHSKKYLTWHSTKCIAKILYKTTWADLFSASQDVQEVMGVSESVSPSCEEKRSVGL